MQKQNLEYGDFDQLKNEAKSAIKDLEYNPYFQRILESQANFLIENAEEQEYSDAVAWLIATVRRSFIMAIVCAEIASKGDDKKNKEVNEISQKIHEDLYGEKRPVKLKLVK